MATMCRQRIAGPTTVPARRTADAAQVGAPPLTLLSCRDAINRPRFRADVRYRGARHNATGTERALIRAPNHRGQRPTHRYAVHGPAAMPDLLRGVALRLRWRQLVEHHNERLPLGLLALVNGMVSIGLMAALAEVTGEPLVFPSLGPTAFLLFYRPHAEVSCPRNALVGHLIGAVSGLVSLTAFGLLHHGPAIDHMTSGRIGAAALSLGLTAAGMIWFGTPHPPAGATTLIISLGFLDTAPAVGVLLAGVALLVVQGFAVNRWAGIDYPIWRPHQPRPDQLSPGTPQTAYRILVIATGERPLEPCVVTRLRIALGDRVRELREAPHEWTAVLPVEADNIDDATAAVRIRVEAAEEIAGLHGWRFRCWEVREDLLPLDGEPPHWHPRLPHAHRASVR